jgi:hypothetical protein
MRVLSVPTQNGMPIVLAAFSLCAGWPRRRREVQGHSDRHARGGESQGGAGLPEPLAESTGRARLPLREFAGTGFRALSPFADEVEARVSVRPSSSNTSPEVWMQPSQRPRRAHNSRLAQPI